MDRHFHIVGIGRAGTTLLQSLLNSHPSIWAGPENYFIPFFYNAWKDKTHWDAKDLELAARFHNSFGKLQPYVGFYFDTDRLLKAKSINSYASFIQSTYNAFVDELAPEKIASVFVNKNPIHSLYINELLRIDPKSKFIWMMRDYRANIHSRKKSKHLKTANVYYNMVRWLRFEKKLSAFAARHPDQILIVNYEDLVTQPNKIMDQVFSFLSMAPVGDVQEMLAPYQKLFETEVTQHYQNTERMKKRFGDLAQPIHADAISQWKTGLTKHEIDVCESLANGVAKKYGYEDIQKRSRFQVLWIQTKALFFELRVTLEHIKDRCFNALPISFKVYYFEKWVDKIQQKRRNNVER